MHPLLAALSTNRPTSRDALARRLVAVGDALTDLSVDSLIAPICPGLDFAQVADLDHVGFIGPPGLGVHEAAAMVSAATFDRDHNIHPSVVVARQLSELRRKPVHVDILLAFGMFGGRRRGVEIFLPVADDDEMRRWIEADVATHLAFSLKDRQGFRDVRRALEAVGFRVPKFARAEPLTVIPRAEGTLFLTMYVDGHVAGTGVRVELCCYASKVTPSCFPSPADDARETT